MKPRTSVRMTDVARAAGVALVTVSRAINEPAKVAPATLAAVREAIDRLGYVPDLVAGSLASTRSRIVGALVPTLENTWFAETMAGLAAELGAAGYQLMLAQSSYPPDAERGLVDAFIGRRVDALVLTGAVRDAALRRKLRSLALPVVETWDLPPRPIDMAVGFSHRDAGAQAARHLVARGRHRLALIGADQERSRMRLEGFREHLAHAGMALAGLELAAPPSSIELGRELMARLAASSPGVDGVFCSNDLLAIGALLWARENGWAVPRRLAVVGFSDLAIARAASPPLTTLRVHTSEIGRRAGALVLARLRGQRPARKSVDLGVELVERETT